MIPSALETGPAPSAVSPPRSDLTTRLRRIAVAALPRMYSRAAHRYVFTVRREREGPLMPAGVSDRYSAIMVIGLAADGLEKWDLPYEPAGLVADMVKDLATWHNLGDAALIAWAARAIGVDSTAAWAHVKHLFERRAAHSTVEVAWALAAATIDHRTAGSDLQRRLAENLLTAWNPATGLFGHTVGGHNPRSHVSCFADQVYPIFALARYAAQQVDLAALDAAARCGRRICALQGPAGQWYWHYDPRSGLVVEGYPVYAVHQDAMAPMALRALQDAGGGQFEAFISKGLGWLESAPELHGGSLIDDDAHMVWRKVARREPLNVTRYVQAACTRLHQRLRAPGVDVLFPPGVVDREDRPYHWGWFLYAWAPEQDSHV
jgi:hypothetical protein